MTDPNWQRICPADAIVPDTGVCALVDGKQIAIFRLDDGTVRAIDNHDPFSGANVLSRGIVGGLEGERVVASPIYKQHFSLATGRCLEDAGNSVDAYPVKVVDGDIWLAAVPKRRYLPPAPQPEEPASLVVVGNGMVAMRAVEELLERAPARYRITVFGAEPRGSYNRIQLSSVLSGEQDAEAVTTHPPKWYADNAITFHAGDAVVAIDRTRRCVRSASGREVEYDRLLIATGSDPLIPPIDGAGLDGVTTFRDLDDVDALIAASAERRRAVVIGGGLLGLEAASGLCARGMDVTVLHLADHLMERQLDVKAGTMLKATLAERGIRVRLGAETRRIAGSAGRVERVELADGTSVPADLVVIAIGIRPNIALARDAGLACGRGVLVNDTLQTFDPRVYAVGECVEHRGATYGLVAPLYEQAGICAGQLAGEGGKGYRGSVSGTQLKISGVKVYSAGDINGDEHTEDLVLHDPRRGLYKRLILRSNRVVGTVLFGDTDDGPWYFDLIRTGADVSAMRSRLLFGAAYCEEAA